MLIYVIMRICISVLGLLLAALLINCQGIKEASKKHSPEGVATYESGDQSIRIRYSRPYKKGRLIFGEKSQGALVPYGKKWRTGANEATEISFSQAITINDSVLPAGTYSLYTIPGPDTWVVAFNSRTDYWGATIPGTPFRSGKDVLRVEAQSHKRTEVLDQLLISLHGDGDEVEMTIEWDDQIVRIPMLL